MLRLLLICVGLLVLAASPLSAEAADNLRMSVRPGHDGVAKLGTWFPVEVQIANTGADLDGEIQIKIDGLDNRGSFNRPPVVYSVPAVLPRQSSKRFVLEVFLPAPVEKISARLVSGGDVVAAAEAPFERVGQNELLCGVLAGNRSSLDFLPAVELSGRQRHIRIAHLDPGDLPPAPQLLSSLDCLVISNVSLASIGEAQKEALHSWTAAGGLLVIAGGPGWQKTLAGLPPALLPVEVVGTAPLRTARALESFGGAKIEDPGPWIAAQARPTDGTVILSEDGLPLIVAARRGYGAVFFLALDPSLEPLRSWRGSPQLWKYLAGYVPGQIQLPSNFIRPYANWGRMPRNALSDLSPLRPPSTEWLPSLMLLYALAVGPLTYLVLGRLGRLEWALWTVPALTAVAALGTFAFARDSSESDILFNKVSLVRAWDGQAEGYARTYVSAFSPRDGTYQIEIAGRDGGPGSTDNLIWPLFYPFPVATGTPTPDAVALTVRRGGGTELTGFALGARSLGTFQVDSAAVAAADVEAKLVLGNGAVSGTIKNRSAEKIADAALVVGGDVVRLGNLSPGETRQVMVPVGDGSPLGYVDVAAVVRQLYPNPSQATPVSSAESVSREILESALNTGFAFATRLELSPVSLVGWMERAPVAVQARQARTTELDRTLLVTTLPVDAQAGEEQRIPSPLIERRNLIAGTGRISQNNMTLSSGETLLLEYILPQRPDQFQIDDVGLDLVATSLGTTDLGDVVQAAVYDWPSAEWRELSYRNGPLDLGDPTRVVSALGQLRLRLNYRPTGGTNANLTLDRFDLAVRGRGV
ncbi:MAG TPA: hypothetical protein VGM69_22695 [Chloroflexota bacterium]